MKSLLIALALVLIPAAAMAACPSYPYTLTNGQTADANQVMSNFNSVRNCVNTGTASSGANSNITSLSGLTTPLSVGQGGTGATTGAGAMSLLGGLSAANNLTDVANELTALSNLGGLAKVNNLSEVASPTVALTNLLPSQGGNAGEVLQTNGSVAAWGAAAPLVTAAEFTNGRTNGTASGETLAGTAWTQRVLNTTNFNAIPGVTLASNQLSLPAGTYDVTASASAEGASLSGSPTTFTTKLRIRNITDSTTLVSGQNVYAAVNGNLQQANATAVLNSQFTLAATKTIELDSWVNSAGDAGPATFSGETEVYVNLYLRKVG